MNYNYVETTSPIKVKELKEGKLKDLVEELEAINRLTERCRETTKFETTFEVAIKYKNFLFKKIEEYMKAKMKGKMAFDIEEN